MSRSGVAAGRRCAFDQHAPGTVLPTETETPHVNPDHNTPRRTADVQRHQGVPGVGARSVSKPRLLLALTSGLLAALILNLVVFDDLRTDASADIAGTFLAPQHLTSISRAYWPWSSSPRATDRRLASR